MTATNSSTVVCSHQHPSPKYTWLHDELHIGIQCSFEHRIRRVDMSSGYISTIAGGGSSKDEDTPTTSFSLSDPCQALYKKSTGDGNGWEVV